MKIEIYNFSATQKGFDWSDLNKFATTIMLTQSRKDKQDFWIKYFEKQINVFKMMNCDKNIELFDNSADLYMTFTLPENLKGKEYLQNYISNGFTKAYNTVFDKQNSFTVTSPKFWDKPYLVCNVQQQYETVKQRIDKVFSNLN
jgi:hypothetical protein